MSDKNLDSHQQQVFNQNLDKEINSIYLELNTMKISFQELRDLLSDAKKQSYKNNGILGQVKDDLAREIKTRKTENEGMEKTIKELKMQVFNLENSETKN